MPIYRLIKNGVVVNTIVATPEVIEQIENQYDSVEEVIQPPPPPPPGPEPITRVSPIEFKLLFLSPERIALRNSTDPVIQDFYDIVDDPRLTFVDLTIPATTDALLYLQSQGIISDRRRLQILNAENPTPDTVSSNTSNSSSNTANTGP